MKWQVSVMAENFNLQSTNDSLTVQEPILMIVGGALKQNPPLWCPTMSSSSPYELVSALNMYVWITPTLDLTTMQHIVYFLHWNNVTNLKNAQQVTIFLVKEVWYTTWKCGCHLRKLHVRIKVHVFRQQVYSQMFLLRKTSQNDFLFQALVFIRLTTNFITSCVCHPYRLPLDNLKVWVLIPIWMTCLSGRDLSVSISISAYACPNNGAGTSVEVTSSKHQPCCYGYFQFHKELIWSGDQTSPRWLHTPFLPDRVIKWHSLHHIFHQLEYRQPARRCFSRHVGHKQNKVQICSFMWRPFRL